ncbi:MAG: hypothetical protein N2C14_09545 [Planctomycetales bacterium]
MVTPAAVNNGIRRFTIALFVSLSAFPAVGAEPPRTPNHLAAVRAFGQSLISRARSLPSDSSDDLARGVWPARIPIGPPRPGPSGHANLAHESSTLRLFRVLSEVSDDGSFRLAANAYVADYLDRGQCPQTGLLAWGPELRLDIATGKVVSQTPPGRHAFVPRTPPWEVLWDSDPKATAKAIAGLEYHFLDSEEHYFAPAAAFGEAKRPTSGQPQCWQAGLMTHAFAFLYHKTGRRKWLDKARGCADLFWKRKRGGAYLVPASLGDATTADQVAGPEQVLIGYFLVKAWKHVPRENEFGEHAVLLIEGFDRACHDPGSNNWRVRAPFGGTARPEEKQTEKERETEKPELLSIWKDHPERIVSVPLLGRASAYVAGVTGDRVCLDVARRCFDLLERTPRGPSAGVASSAFALGLSLDLYDLSKDKKYLAFAEKLAADSLKRFSKDGLFRDGSETAFYDASSSAGDLAAALLRLHLRSRRFRPARLYDWTF